MDMASKLEVATLEHGRLLSNAQAENGVLQTRLNRLLGKAPRLSVDSFEKPFASIVSKSREEVSRPSLGEVGRRPSLGDEESALRVSLVLPEMGDENRIA